MFKFSEIITKFQPGLVHSNSLTNNPELNPDIDGVTSIEEAKAGKISYIAGQKFASLIKETWASALILPLNENLQKQAIAREIAWVATPDPRLLFAEAIAFFYQPYHPQPQIHPTAVIDPSATIGEGVSIGARVVIGEKVTIGAGVCIFPNVVIYPEAKIGDRTVLHAKCTIQERTLIGTDCVIGSGAVIGGEGFGFVPTAKGWYKMEQSGYVVLENGVEVGSNSTIDRPSVGETRIGHYTKIDNLVQIGHGCRIGNNCALAGQVGLSGKVMVGNGVLLAGQVGVANQVNISDGAIATAGSGLHKDVPLKNAVSGYPAVPNKLWLKTVAIYKRLPELYQTLLELKQKK